MWIYRTSDSSNDRSQEYRLNEAQCDIATIGNNEGMTISHEALNNLYNNATFNVICTNVIDEEGKLPHNIASSCIKKLKAYVFYL